MVAHVTWATFSCKQCSYLVNPMATMCHNGTWDNYDLISFDVCLN